MIKQEDRRAYPRLPAYHLAKYKVISPSQEEGILSMASVKDIGGGGVCLRLEKPLATNNIIQLYINFPGLSCPIPVLAKVVWMKKLKAKTNLYEVGMQFLEIDGILRGEIIKRVGVVRKRLQR